MSIKMQEEYGDKIQVVFVSGGRDTPEQVQAFALKKKWLPLLAEGLRAAVPHLFRDAGVAALTLLSYGALFALFGVALRRPVIPGLLFLFVWELIALLPGYLPRFTLTAYLRSLVTHRPPDEGLAEVFGQVLPTALSLQTLAVLVVLFLGLASWIFSRKEYVLEQ